MNNRGLLGLLIVAGIVIALIAGGYLFFKVSKNNIEIGTGNIILNIDYNLSADKAETPKNSQEDEVISITDKTENQSEEDSNETITFDSVSNSSDYNNP